MILKVSPVHEVLRRGFLARVRGLACSFPELHFNELRSMDARHRVSILWHKISECVRVRLQLKSARANISGVQERKKPAPA